MYSELGIQYNLESEKIFNPKLKFKECIYVIHMLEAWYKMAHDWLMELIVAQDTNFLGISKHNGAETVIIINIC